MDGGGLAWHGCYDLNTSDLIDSVTVKTSKRECAKAKMIQMLEKEDRPGTEIYDALASMGIGRRTVEKVKKDLQITGYRAGGVSYWSMPKNQE